MVCAPVRSIIPSLKLGDYLSVQAHKPCSISHLYIHLIFVEQIKQRHPQELLDASMATCKICHTFTNLNVSTKCAKISKDYHKEETKRNKGEKRACLQF